MTDRIDQYLAVEHFGDLQRQSKAGDDWLASVKPEAID